MEKLGGQPVLKADSFTVFQNLLLIDTKNATTVQVAASRS